MSICVENVSYIYGKGTPFERAAIEDIDLTIDKGEFIGIIGHTGSGKSTLIQHLNGLLHPSVGKVTVDGVDLAEKTKEAMVKRHSVGMVFQYPEHQLFEETVAKDIAFGPQNQGCDEEETEKRVKSAMRFAGIDYETFAERSPFRLSGGQQRRVAIAGVIAMHPDFLILDEPSAGLDPVGRREIFSRIQGWYKKGVFSVILVSHNMDDIARLATRLLVMHQGRLVLDGEPMDIFLHHRETLKECGVEAPPLTQTLLYLKEKEFLCRKPHGQWKRRRKNVCCAGRREIMLTDITLGQYYPGDSFLHRMDPRAKILCTMIFICAIFLANNPWSYLLVTVFTLGCIMISGVPPVMVWKAVKPLWVILVFTLLIHVLTTPGKEIFGYGFIHISEEGLRNGLFMTLRLVFLIGFSSLLTYTTSPIVLTDGIEALLNPFRRFGVPAHELAMMMTIALRFIPTLLEETDRIMKAQASRGADFTSGNLWQKAKGMVPLLVPLFISAFRRADDLATAMEARCYRGGEGRTKMHQLAYTSRDTLAFITVFLVTAVLLAMYFYFRT